MKALVKYAKGRDGMAIQDVPVPKPQENEVRIAIRAAGICGSDIHAMQDDPSRKVQLPVILGHEFVGEVDAVGKRVTTLNCGDWVTGLPACYSCGVCSWCQRGEVTLCDKRQSIGTHRNGAMAEYMVMPAEYCFRIADAGQNKLAYAVAEPLACAVHAVYERADVKPGDVAVVSGPGAMGLFVLQALKCRGAYVIVSGLPADRHRLDKALSLGADKTVDSYDALLAAVAEKSPAGADLVVEATGVAGSLAICLRIVRKQGMLLQVGVYGHDISCDFNAIFSKELVVTGSNSTTVSSWKTTLELLSQKKIQLEPVISLKLPLMEWEKGFDAAIDKSAYKVLLIP